jgi:hypothetical protein
MTSGDAQMDGLTRDGAIRSDASDNAADANRAGLTRLITGFQVSQAIHVAAMLRLADHLAGGARTAAELAALSGAHAGALHRLLRALASVGVLRERERGLFELTAVGAFLRSDVAGTHAPWAEMMGGPHVWQAWGDLLHAVRTGAPAFDHVHGCGVWEYRAGHPDANLVFDRAMASGTVRHAEAMIGAYDFGRFDHIVDIGGGDGMFLEKILAAYPHVHGTLLDQPHVAARAASRFAAGDVSARCAAVGGDFFASVPEGRDGYLLKWILHDWDDEACIRIMRSCRRAMKPDGRLLVVEHVIGPAGDSPEGPLLDLMMLVMTEGRERTKEEFARLLAAAGFRLVSLNPTSTLFSVMEAAPV